ncbi:hypothetical protein [Hyphobacterium marinum]|uniref:Uncharacterized protein n=1 Tax=Hyphobacterium marinum TaxID=3116574 RepID=A0ABU7LZY2_9PROT|nr:hypothetical protein [Hyphobacterium sp. Y6023]MEE2567108.1 hypothetical protein [Hyphobacterium sp. Y6023]
MRQFQAARWTDDGQTLVEAVRTDGQTVFIPADLQNRDYRSLIHGDPESPGQPAIAPLDIQPPHSS